MKPTKKKVIIAIIIILLLLLTGAVLFFAFNHQPKNSASFLPTDDNAVIWNGEQQIPRTTNGKEGIDIPGFDTLVFRANQIHQRVNFFNPKQNNCLFKMTLFVNDKSIWQSGYCASGSGYYEIDIDRPLQAGDYPSYLQVECFKPDGTALNGAKVEFNLIVEDNQ